MKPEAVEQIVRLAVLHPSRGCDWLAAKALRPESSNGRHGIKVSKTTVQTVITDAHLGTKRDRWLALERQLTKTGRKGLTPEQVRFLELRNPNFREFDTRSRRPGELLFCDTVLLGTFNHLGRVYMHVVVDSFSAYAFGVPVKLPTAASAREFLDDIVLKYLGGRGVTAKTVQLTQAWNGKGEERLMSNILALKYGIAARLRPLEKSRISGFVQSFQKAARAEFIGAARRRSSSSVSALQAEFFKWRKSYNNRAFDGYPCFGGSPNEMFRRKAK